MRSVHELHDALSRRSFLRGSLLGGASLAACGGVGPALARALAGGADDEPAAKCVIHVFLAGGLSHIDSLDPKPNAPVETRGEYRPIPTAIDGVQFTEVMPRIAKVADRFTFIRSMTHGEAAHERGVHNMMTGYRPSPVITYPSMGSVVAHELGAGRNSLPAYVCVPNGVDFSGTGYLSAAFAPFEIGAEPRSRDFRVRDLTPPEGVGEERLARRRAIVADLDADFAERGRADAVDASAAFYEQAYALIGSPDGRAAFDVEKEPRKLREKYGGSRIGQRLLLARRLAESGVRFVHVPHTGFDNHDNIFTDLRRRMAVLDRALSALIVDLEERGLLESTLVLVSTEFGRTPRVNSDAGRDHWPRAFSVALAGAGIKRGYVHGQTNATGSEPVADAVSPADLAATVYRQLGVDYERELMSPGDRPIEIVREARVVREILA